MKSSTADAFVYCLGEGEVIIHIYVDEMMIMGWGRNSIDTVNTKLKNKFEVGGPGEACYLLGITIKHDGEIVSVELSQETYATVRLHNLGMMESIPITTPTEVSAPVTGEELFLTELT